MTMTAPPKKKKNLTNWFTKKVLGRRPAPGPAVTDVDTKRPQSPTASEASHPEKKVTMDDLTEVEPSESINEIVSSEPSPVLVAEPEQPAVDEARDAAAAIVSAVMAEAAASVDSSRVSAGEYAEASAEASAEATAPGQEPQELNVFQKLGQSISETIGSIVSPRKEKAPAAKPAANVDEEALDAAAAVIQQACMEAENDAAAEQVIAAAEEVDSAEEAAAETGEEAAAEAPATETATETTTEPATELATEAEAESATESATEAEAKPAYEPQRVEVDGEADGAEAEKAEKSESEELNFFVKMTRSISDAIINLVSPRRSSAQEDTPKEGEAAESHAVPDETQEAGTASAEESVVGALPLIVSPRAEILAKAGFAAKSSESMVSNETSEASDEEEEQVAQSEAEAPAKA